MRSLGEEEVTRVQARLAAEEMELASLLIPKDPRDDKNIFLEVRAGTGGDEAAIFAGDLFRMYARYAESQGLGVEVMSESPGEHGGYKEIISRIVGRGVFSRLKFESGTHRVQRVPATEAQGRIHTSACTVAILPELDEVESVDINPGGPAHRHLPLLRRRRPARQQDGFRHPHHAPAHRASWWNARMSARSTRTARAPWRCSRRACSRRSRRSSRARRRSRASCRWAAAIAPSASAPTTSRRVASPTTASTSRCTSSPDVMNGDLDELLDALQQEYRAEQLAAEGMSERARDAPTQRTSCRQRHRGGAWRCRGGRRARARSRSSSTGTSARSWPSRGTSSAMLIYNGELESVAAAARPERARGSCSLRAPAGCDLPPLSPACWRSRCAGARRASAWRACGS